MSCRYAQSRRQLPPSQWTPLDRQPLTFVGDAYVTMVSWVSSLGVLLVFSVVSALLYLRATITSPQLIMLISLMFFIGVLFIIVIHLQAKQLQYAVFPYEFMIRKGLFWRSTIAMPYTRLQHVSLEQNPVERKFKLFTLKCFSAGSGSAEIELPGLSTQVAEQLRQHLLKQASGGHEPNE
ncbi:PH domain-containing protein [Shewanella corallii]|uniref:PH domain-containing protein n=1 Tax=Shewanella corallii TaxID=560080 RepID=A0ABT0N2N5_9GAMM|nr:PH domain-containing protein [Shewanella corallii]MCL2912694.1 PH domain-containing protein [Shewanella corallii]